MPIAENESTSGGITEERTTVDKRKFLVVIDPSHEQTIELDRMVEIIRGRRRATLAEVHLFIGFESEDKSDPNILDEIFRGPEWTRQLIQPLIELDVDFTVDYFWAKHWQRSIVDAVKRYDCDAIILSKSSAENKSGIADSKWALLRRAQCEVVIVGTDSGGPLNCILASVNIQSQDPERQALNEKILNRGKTLAKFYGAKFHVVNSYKSAEDFPDRERIQLMTDLPRENIHRDMGRPEDIISAVVTKVNADLVILGTKARQGLRTSLRSNVSEKIIDKLTVDVIALN
jgi:universal stress protein E